MRVYRGRIVDSAKQQKEIILIRADLSPKPPPERKRTTLIVFGGIHVSPRQTLPYQSVVVHAYVRPHPPS